MALGIIDLISLGQGGVAGLSGTPYTPIVFPLAIPSQPGFRRLRMRQERAQLVSMSPTTLSSQVVESSGERWVCEVTLPDMFRDKAGAWMGFFNMLDGKRGTFMLGDALGRTPQGNPAGTPKVKDANQTGTTLTIYGCVPDTVGWAVAGDYFQIGERLHQVSRQADADPTGTVVLDFWPRLREVYAVDTALVTASAKGLFRLQQVSYDMWEVDERQVYSISFTAEEKL